MENKQQYKIPLHSKKKKCIGCGNLVGSKAGSHIKKANSVGMDKSLKFWFTQEVVVHWHDYKLCNSCYNMENIVLETRETSNISDFKILVDLLSAEIKKQTNKKEEPVIMEFGLDITKLSEENCIECCGLSTFNLKELAEDSNCSIQIIFEFFCKCRQILSNRFAGVLFGKDQSTLSKNFDRVLDKLTEIFVPKWLGASAFTREDIIKNHTPYLFEQILPNVRGGIDGTYFYATKSSDFNSQRKTYNKHKGRNLFKEMGIILPDGRIFDLIGPFFSDGDHNDEWMWRYITDTNCGDLKDVFDLFEDEFLADRGFLRVLEGEGLFSLRTPVGLLPKQKQLSVVDANNSRLVTRFRNVVERVFGRLKARWKLISGVISSGLWPKLHQILRLLAAVENAFFPALWHNEETDEDDIAMMEERLQMEENKLKEIHETKSKGCWEKKTYEELKEEIPLLTLEEIRKWSVGPYALTLAKPYLEHSNELKFWKHKTENRIYKIKGMISRFVTSDKTQAKKYCILLQIPSNGEVEQILSYCTCKSGARTLGGCAHSCAILYHLTIHDDKLGNKPNTAKKRVSTSGTIDLKSYKAQKMEEIEEKKNLSEEDDDNVE